MSVEGLDPGRPHKAAGSQLSVTMGPLKDYPGVAFLGEGPEGCPCLLTHASRDPSEDTGLNICAHDVASNVKVDADEFALEQKWCGA